MHQISEDEYALLQAAKNLREIFGVLEGNLVTLRSQDRATAESAITEVVRLAYECPAVAETPASASIWLEFDDGEMWWAGEVLWLWQATWKAPRLAIADEENPGDWKYIRGKTVGEEGEPWPTHCCYLSVPVPPEAAAQ